MDRINYKHLYYFWMVAREGGVGRACAKLHLAQPTVSSQLAAFEEALGEKLFSRNGRRLTLTETGRLVFRYAEEIFALGRELGAALKGGERGRALRLTVGVTETLPKLVVYRLLEPVLQLAEPVKLFCHEGKADRLLAELALGELDLVLSDTPTTAAGLFNHLLGECSVSVFAAPALAACYRLDFPRSLTGAPFVLPTSNTALRRSLDQWFDALDLRPRICAEIEDSALLKTFGSGGVGLFVAPAAVEKEVRRQYQVDLVGHIEAVTERFYAFTRRGRLCHPAVTALLERAGEKSGCH